MSLSGINVAANSAAEFIVGSAGTLGSKLREAHVVDGKPKAKLVTVPSLRGIGCYADVCFICEKHTEVGINDPIKTATHFQREMRDNSPSIHCKQTTTNQAPQQLPLPLRPWQSASSDGCALFVGLQVAFALAQALASKCQCWFPNDQDLDEL